MPYNYPFKGKKGNAKGKPLDQCDTEDLMFLIQKSDLSHPTFGPRNAEIVKECNQIINTRTDGGAKKPVAKKIAPEAKARKEERVNVDSSQSVLIREFRKFVDEIYNTAEAMSDRLTEIETTEAMAGDNNDEHIAW